MIKTAPPAPHDDPPLSARLTLTQRSPVLTMPAILNVVFPIFALILLGYLCRKRAILSANAVSELNRFVIYLALPALLFDSTARLAPANFSNLRFIAIFAIGITTVFLLTAWIRRRQGANTSDIIIDSLGASYANVGFIGVPLSLLAFGHDSLAPAVIAMIMTACLLFAIAIILLEICIHAQQPASRNIGKVALSLLRNPILIAPLLGCILAASNYTLPSGMQQLFTLLAASASPCALVSLGLFLAQPIQNKQTSSVNLLVSFKLLLQPTITAIFAYWIMPLPKLWADTALLLSALPIGTGPFMLAELYQREAALMSRAILISTTASLLTISLILVWITP